MHAGQAASILLYKCCLQHCWGELFRAEEDHLHSLPFASLMLVAVLLVFPPLDHVVGDAEFKYHGRVLCLQCFHAADCVTHHAPGCSSFLWEFPKHCWMRINLHQNITHARNKKMKGQVYIMPSRSRRRGSLAGSEFKVSF